MDRPPHLPRPRLPVSRRDRWLGRFPAVRGPAADGTTQSRADRTRDTCLLRKREDKRLMVAVADGHAAQLLAGNEIRLMDAGEM